MSDIETANHQPCIASCGVPLVFAELKERRALAAAQPRADFFARDLQRDRVTGRHLYVKERSGGFDLQVRMFAPLYGIPEDPAIGQPQRRPDRTHCEPAPRARSEPREIAHRPGIDMGRPSLLEARAEKRAGKVTAPSIGGPCVPVMHGTLSALGTH